MSIIAVRRNLSANALFFKQEQNHIYTSLDGVNWVYAWTLPTAKTGIGNEGWDISKSDQYYIDVYNNYNDQSVNINALVNAFTPPINRTEGLARADEILQTMYDPNRLCYAYYAILRIARDLKVAVANGQLEPDDAERAKDFVGAIPFAGGLIGLAITVSIDLLNLDMQLTDQQIQDYACCMYSATRLGEFNFTQWKTVGTTCGLGAWDEISTPEMYATFCAILMHDRTAYDCECETCLTLNGAGYNVLRGVRGELTATTATYNIGGTVNEMQAQVNYKIPLMIVTSVEVWLISVPYENTYTVRPSLVWQSAGTGGGTTAVTTSYFITRQLITPAHLPLSAIDNFTLSLITSVCSACSAAQLTSYNASFGTIFKVVVCGTLA
jgi:hypothetical protein